MADSQTESLGKRLRQEREKRQWSQEELAEASKVSVSSIRRLENGRAETRQETLDQLAEALGRPHEEWGYARQIRWNLPLRNIYFTGRDRLLERLHHALAARQIVALNQAQALTGLGGIGKTAAAIEYAYRYAQEYEAVFWIRADTSETLLSDFGDLASVLDLPVRVKQERDQQHIVSLVKRWLEQHGPWLLIFDNADDPARVSHYWPGGVGGAVLLTTRSQTTGSHIEPIEMDRMSREEGIRFLLRRIHRIHNDKEQSTGVYAQEQEEAGKLWECVDGVPLALDQAAAYLEETGCTLSDYLDMFETGRKVLLKRRGKAGEHPEPVAVTWLMALKNIERGRTPAAADLLRFCALLHPDAIPEDMIRKGAFTPALQSIAMNKPAWNEAVAELHAYSLARRVGRKRILTMHRLVQAVIQDDMDQKTLQEWAECAVRAVNTAFPDPDSGSWSQYEPLMPHAELAAHYINVYHIRSSEAGRLLYGMASYFYTRARYADAEPYYQRALSIREQEAGLDHLDVAESLDGLATLYREQGEYAKAEPLYRRALGIRELRLKAEHPDVAISLEGLAVLYKEQGRYAESESFHLRALAIREQHWGSDHLLVASSFNGLGLLYKEQGRYPEAKKCFRRSLAIRQKELGKEHPQVGASLNNLAILYTAQGKYAVAERLQRRALAITVQAYGEEYPGIATDLNNLAVACYEQRKYTEVVPLLERALRLWKLYLGEEHPHVGMALSNLAEIHAMLGHYTESERLYRQSMHVWARQPEPRHPDEAYPLDGIAGLYRAWGKYAEAEQFYQRALRVREQALGTDNPITKETRARLKDMLDAMGLHKEAEP